MMTLRERWLTTLRGGVSDRIPRNIYASLLPQTPAARAVQRKGLGLTASCRTDHAIYEGVTIHEERQETDGRPLLRVHIETPVGALTEGATIESQHGSRWVKSSSADIWSSVAQRVLRQMSSRRRIPPSGRRWLRTRAMTGRG